MAFDLTAPGGKACLYGIYPQGVFPIDFSHARRHELEIVFVRRSLPRNYPEAIRMAACGEIDLAPIVTHTFPLREIHQAFQVASQRTDGVIKAVLSIS